MGASRSQATWRPWILRFSGLGTVFATSIVAIALLECAARKIPIKFERQSNVTVTLSVAPTTAMYMEKRHTSLMLVYTSVSYNTSVTTAIKSTIIPMSTSPAYVVGITNVITTYIEAVPTASQSLISPQSTNSSQLVLSTEVVVTSIQLPLKSAGTMASLASSLFVFGITNIFTTYTEAIHTSSQSPISALQSSHFRQPVLSPEVVATSIDLPLTPAGTSTIITLSTKTGSATSQLFVLTSQSSNSRHSILRTELATTLTVPPPRVPNASFLAESLTTITSSVEIDPFTSQLPGVSSQPNAFSRLTFVTEVETPPGVSAMKTTSISVVGTKTVGAIHSDSTVLRTPALSSQAATGAPNPSSMTETVVTATETPQFLSLSSHRPAVTSVLHADSQTTRTTVQTVASFTTSRQTIIPAATSKTPIMSSDIYNSTIISTTASASTSFSETGSREGTPHQSIPISTSNDLVLDASITISDISSWMLSTSINSTSSMHDLTKSTLSSTRSMLGSTTSTLAQSRILSTTSSAPPTLTSISNSTDSLVEIISRTDFYYPWWASVLASILPVALAAVYKVLWIAVNRSVKLMAPFMQASRATGATIEDSLINHYLSFDLTPDFLTKCSTGHWKVFWASLGCTLASFAGPLASEVLFTERYQCATGQTGYNATTPSNCAELDGRLASIRALQALIGLLAALILGVATTLIFNKTTGVYADPSSVSGIAALVHHPDIVEMFLTIDSEASAKEMGKLIGYRKVALRLYRTSLGEFRYEFTPMDHECDKPNNPKDRLLVDHHAVQPVPSEKQQQRPSTGLDIISILALAGLILGVLAVVVAYYIDRSPHSGFNIIFGSATWGLRFILTGAGSVIAILWQRMERDVQLLTIYAQLAKGDATPQTTIHVTRASTPATALLPALRRGNYMLAMVAAQAILSDCLVITLAGVPFGYGQVYKQTLACFFISMGILGLMVGFLPLLVLWKRRRPYFPRTPDTVAAVVSYIVGGRLVSYYNVGEYKGPGMWHAGFDSNLRCSYGVYDGVDSSRRWMIDVDEGEQH